MESMDRRLFLRSRVGGATIATAAATAGLTLIPDVAEATPLAMDKGLPEMMERFAENAQVVIVAPRRRRRRRRVCWWHRGRRVCRWRYW
jgi:hypothetical protein